MNSHKPKTVFSVNSCMNSGNTTVLAESELPTVRKAKGWINHYPINAIEF